ncbi:hypothetical protein OJJOAM_000844 [Cupriavidus sp. H18C1]
MQSKHSKQGKRSMLAFGAVALAIGGAPAAAWAWEPTKPVEIVVPFSAGGASDQMARSIQSIIAKHKLMSQPVIVVNKAGASGAEGLMDTKASQGNPHKLLVTSSALYTVPMVSHLPFSWRDLTPIAMVAQDEFVLWTNAEAPYKTVAEFVEGAKAGAGKVKMGGTSSKREDQIITTLIQKKTGAKFIYVPYKGGGEAATQLSGKHIDANVNNPPNRSASGAPASTARCACSRPSGWATPPRSPSRRAGATCRPARSRGWTSSTRCCACS